MRRPRNAIYISAGWCAKLPRSKLTRTPRESRTRERTHEIQRLIGRSLRAIVDMEKLGERTLTVDCDVLQVDGGTRTAAITGSYVALHQACENLVKNGAIKEMPIRTAVTTTSVGIIQGEFILDLYYEEDFAAGVDFNIVMTGEGDFVEVQGTAEGEPFSQQSLDEVLKAAREGSRELL